MRTLLLASLVIAAAAGCEVRKRGKAAASTDAAASGGSDAGANPGADGSAGTGVDAPGPGPGGSAPDGGAAGDGATADMQAPPPLPATFDEFWAFYQQEACARTDCFPRFGLTGDDLCLRANDDLPVGEMKAAIAASRRRFRPAAGQSCLARARGACDAPELQVLCSRAVLTEPASPLGGRCHRAPDDCAGGCDARADTDCVEGACDAPGPFCPGKCAAFQTSGSCMGRGYICDPRTHFCDVTGTGQCQPKLESGADCTRKTSAACPEGQVCRPELVDGMAGARFLCKRLPSVGDECGPRNDCLPGFNCVGGVCRLPGAVGMACDRRNPSACQKGLICHREGLPVAVFEGTCQPAMKAGGACRSPLARDCEPPLACLKMPTQQTATPSLGICGAPRALGEPCVDDDECAPVGPPGARTGNLCYRNVCTAYPVAGGPCRWDEFYKESARCPPEMYCQGGSASAPGRCTAYAKDGEGCSGRDCLPHLFCDAATTRCTTTPPPATCELGCHLGQYCAGTQCMRCL